MQKIVIVDYGMANLRSVQKAFEKVGFAAEISGDPNRLAEADKMVLPGVGAFRDAIAPARSRPRWSRSCAHIRAGKPFFGICLGLQLLFTTSYEDGVQREWMFFQARWCVSATFRASRCRTWAGTNFASKNRRRTWLELGEEPSVYFVHSYYVVARRTRT